MLTETPTPVAGLTPASLEAHYASVPSAALTTLLATLRADPAWTVTEWTAGGRLVQVDLIYQPSGEAFTLRPTRRDQEPSGGARQ